MKIKTVTAFIVLFALLISACGGGSTAANVDAKDALGDPSQDHISDPTPIDTPEPHPLSGLVFKDGTTLWQIETDGQQTHLSNCAPTGFDSALSPDHTHMLYSEAEDIWQIDLTSCTASNLTNTPNNFELNPQYWPAQGQIVFGANPEFHAGVPGSMMMDGGNYAILDESGAPNYPVALSPNNSYMAYLSADGPLIYNVADGARIPFDVGFYGMDAATLQRMDSPAWSPDGTKLGWSATTQNGDDFDSWRMNIIVFDLTTRSHTVLFSYIPIGRGGWPPPAVWSPDGQWLAFNAWVENPLSEYGTWIVKADGSEQHLLRPAVPTSDSLLDQYSPPVWSRNSQMLAFNYVNNPADNFYVRVGIWNVQTLAIPNTATVLDWNQ